MSDQELGGPRERAGGQPHPLAPDSPCDGRQNDGQPQPGAPANGASLFSTGGDLLEQVRRSQLAHPELFKAGQRLGEWVLDQRLRASRWCEVWRVRHDEIPGLLAVAKAAASPAAARLLAAEVQAVARLDHPGIAKIIGAATGGQPGYLVRAYVPGVSLRTHIPRGGLPLLEARRLGLQILSGLQHAHERHVFHNDLKPDNIIVLGDGSATLIDFCPGQMDGNAAGPQYWISQQPGDGLWVLGTLAYLSPERRQGRPGGVGGDLYAFGVTWYEMLTGVLPDGDHQKPTRLRPDLPALSDDIYIRATCGLAERVASANELLRLVDRLDRSAASRSPGAPVSLPPGLQLLETNVGPGPTPAAEGAIDTVPRCPATARDGVERQELRVGPGNVDGRSRLVEVLAAAAPGARIHVLPGSYYEALVIDKPVEIIGEGRLAEVVVQSLRTPAMIIEAGQVLVRGLTLRAAEVSASGRTPGGEASTVVVRSGDACIESCDISGDAAACVVVAGPQAAPTISKCRIHGGQYGLVWTDGAAGLVAECEIFDIVAAGVHVTDHARPVLRSCRLFQNREIGIEVLNRGLGCIEGGVVRGSRSGIRIVGCGSNPEVRNVQIVEHREEGVCVLGYGDGRFESCTITNNASVGVLIGDGSHPQFRQCRVARGGVGIVIRGTAGGQIEQCEIRENAGDGIVIQDSATPTVEGCRVKKNAGVGIRITSERVATVKRCVLRANRAGPWSIGQGCGAQLVENSTSFWS